MGSKRTATVVAGLILASSVLTACVPIGPELLGGSTGQEGSTASEDDSSRIEDAVAAAVPGVTDVSSISAQYGLKWGRSVEITRADATPLTADELRAVLRAIWENSSSEPSQVDVRLWSVVDGEKSVVLFDEAAVEIDPDSPSYGGGASFHAANLKLDFGEWKPSS